MAAKGGQTAAATSSDIPPWLVTQPQVAQARVAPSIAALRAMPPPSGPEAPAVLVEGYFAPGDSGGGMFIYDPTCTEPDDGGTIFRPSRSNGRWRRLFTPGYVSASWFGARGDGRSDDATAIQNAINALAGGGVLFLPEGDYFIGDQGIQIDSLVSVVGAGGYQADWRHVSQITYIGLGSAITVNGSGSRVTHGVRISNLCINGANAGSVGISIGNRGGEFKSAIGTLMNVVIRGFVSSGLYLDCAEDCLFEKVRCIYNIGCGCVVGPNSGPTVAMNTSDTFVACEFSDNGDVSRRSAGLAVRDLRTSTFLDCAFEANTGPGILIEKTLANVDIQNVAFVAPWLEANNRGMAGAGEYSQVMVSSPSGSRIAGILFDHPYFSTTVPGNGRGEYFAIMVADATLDICEPDFADGAGRTWVLLKRGHTATILTVSAAQPQATVRGSPRTAVPVYRAEAGASASIIYVREPSHWTIPPLRSGT